MSALRERLLTLADEEAGCLKAESRVIALAAARMALKEAAQTMLLAPIEITPDNVQDERIAALLQDLANGPSLRLAIADSLRDIAATLDDERL